MELENIPADRLSKPIYSGQFLAQSCNTIETTYHPCIAPFPVDEPLGDLPASLYNEQTADTFQYLEDRCRPAQHLIPATYRHILHQSISSKQPFLHTDILTSLETEGPLDPSRRSRILSIDRELVETPYHHSRDSDPLCIAEEQTDSPSEPRSSGR